MSEDQLSGAWPSETLPRSWVWLPFDQFWLDFTDSQKKLPQKAYLPEGRFAVIDQGEARIGGFSNDERLLSPAPVPAIVFGDHTRAVKFIDVPFIQGADGVRVLSTPVGIDRAYAFKALRAVELPDKGYSRHFKFLKATRFPLPPLAEQKRIVAKLDALNAKSARARTELARIETLVSRYKQAVLSKAFSGEFFSSREIGERREASKKRLSDICQSITDGDHQAPPKAPSGVPFITISAMNDGRIDLGKATRFVPETYYEELQSSRKARTGDILYSVTGSYGIPAIVETDRPFVFQRHIAILRPDTSVASAKYLELLLASPEMRGQADAIATGTAQKTVPLKGLRNFEIPLPPLEGQHEIVRRIESAFAKIDRLAKEAKRALELVGKLDEAILAKAFRGELVPQDENDEPAKHLLDRIRAEREAASKVKKRVVKRTSAMLTARDFLNAKLPNWPHDGISFQDLRSEFSGSYDDLKDAVFTLLSDENALLRQVFDEKRSVMTLKRREQ